MTDKIETTEKETVTLVVIGSCLVRHNKEDHTFESEFDVTQAELDSKGIQYLLANKMVKVLDNEKLTKSLIAKATKSKKKDPNEGKTLEQLEEGPDIK